MSERLCKACNAPLVQRDDERGFMFRRRVFCGRQCAGDHHRSSTHKDRPCKGCGNTIPRRPDERASAYKNRSYCSPECVTAARCEHNKERWSSPELRERMSRKGRGWQAQKINDWNRRHAPRDVRFPGASSVEAFLAAGGQITRCAPAFAAPTQGALDDAAAAKRVAAINVDHEADSWKAKRDSARAQIGRQ